MLPICKALIVVLVVLGFADSSTIVRNLNVNRILNNVDQDGAPFKYGACPINVRAVKDCTVCENDLPCIGNTICCPQNDAPVNATEGCCTPALRPAIGRNLAKEDLQPEFSEEEGTDNPTEEYEIDM